jgi:hypothetical protein
MNNTNALIPKEFQIDPLTCDEYLVNGVIEKWKGETSEVYSVITTDGKPTLLGTIPDMETDAALNALEAAKKCIQSRSRSLAYNESGRKTKMHGDFCQKNEAASRRNC